MSSFLEYHMIQEARKNPEMNPKVPAIKIIQQCAEEAPNPWEQYTGDVSNCFVSFTQLDKLGINPTSHYDTPNGLYSYSAKSFENKNVSSDVPFAGLKPFINIFKAKNPDKVIVLNMMGNKQFQDLCDKTREYYVSTKIKKGLEKVRKTQLSQSDHDYVWKKFSDEFEAFINNSEKRAYNTSYGGRWWYIAMSIAHELSSIKKQSDKPYSWGDKKTTFGAPNSWNKLFRGIGVDGVIDTGEGIIHSAEKQQSYFVGADVVELITRIENKEYEKKPLPRTSRTTIGIYMMNACKENNPRKIVKIVSSLAILPNDKYTTMNIIQSLNKSALNQICLKIDSSYNMGGFDSETDVLIEANKNIKTLIESTRLYPPDVLPKDGIHDLFYDIADAVRSKMSDILTFWFLIPIVKECYDKADVRGPLANIPRWAFEHYDQPIPHLVDMLKFFSEVGFKWWEDSFFDGCVNNWDKQFPTTDTQVGVWNSAESWGYVK